MRLFILAILTLFGPISVAQPTATMDVLVNADSRIPGTLIPVRFRGLESGRVIKVGVSSPEGTDCRIMRDPFRTDIYLIKCREETEVRAQVQAVVDRQSYVLNFAAITVKNPGEGLVAVDPGGGANNDAFEGKQIFGSKCVNCHTPVSKKGRTAAQILGAVQFWPEMQYLNTLSSDDYKKIEAYLKKP